MAVLSDLGLERWHQWQRDYAEAPDNNHMSLQFGEVRALLDHIEVQAEVLAAFRWVPVSPETMPSRMERVLRSDMEGYVDSGYITSACQAAELRVTHWRLLPKSAKEMGHAN